MFFKKNPPNNVILKIVENFFNLMKKLNPQEICSAQIYIYMCIYTPVFKLYTVLFSRDSKTKKVRHQHPHPHQHQHQNKTKVFGVESEILIKHERIKWTPRVKASLLFSHGDQKNCTLTLTIHIGLV